jgi:hypothetical protein
MLTTIAQRSRFIVGKVEPNVFRYQVRLVSSSPLTPNNNDKKKNDRRELHNTSRREADAAMAATSVPRVEAPTSSILSRFIITAEVAVSKIFPAGFGWQTGGLIASNQYGWAPDSMSFAYATGIGDAIGVLGGHMLYYSAKKAAVDGSINLTKELHTGILLGSAAFCSGTIWQPCVNALQAANLDFVQVFGGTWVTCGIAFYTGLRVGRTILSGYFQHIQEPTYANSKTDASLSAVIGGAGGFFVGTDAVYLPDQNFLIDVVGIKEGTPDLAACAIAGTSTAMGFSVAQTGFNFIFPAGKCWND